MPNYIPHTSPQLKDKEYFMSVGPFQKWNNGLEMATFFSPNEAPLKELFECFHKSFQELHFFMNNTKILGPGEAINVIEALERDPKSHQRIASISTMTGFYHFQTLKEDGPSNDIKLDQNVVISPVFKTPAKMKMYKTPRTLRIIQKIDNNNNTRTSYYSFQTEDEMAKLTLYLYIYSSIESKKEASNTRSQNVKSGQNEVPSHSIQRSATAKPIPPPQDLNSLPTISHSRPKHMIKKISKEARASLEKHSLPQTEISNNKTKSHAKVPKINANLNHKRHNSQKMPEIIPNLQNQVDEINPPLPKIQVKIESSNKSTDDQSQADDNDIVMELENLEVIQSPNPTSEFHDINNKITKNNSNPNNNNKTNSIIEDRNKKEMKQEKNNSSIKDNYDIPEDFNFEIRLNELGKTISERFVEQYTPPDLDSVLKLSKIQPANYSEIGLRGTNDKISLLLSKFDPEPDQSLFIFNYEDVDNAEIVNSSFLESPINIDKITNIFNFDDFKDCFDKTDLYVEEPYDPIQQELAIIFERFQMSGSNVFNLTDPNSFRLCFLIASIMVNTLRDFTTLQSTFPLYSMLDELSLSFISPVIPELKKESLTTSQASIFSTFLISKNLVGEFFKKVRMREDWITKHYSPVSFMANDQFLKTFTDLYETLFMNFKFNFELNPNIIQSTQSEDITRFVLNPGSYYLVIDQIFHPGTDVVKLLSHQFEYAFKRKEGLFNNFIQSSPWDAISSLLSTPHKGQAWSDFTASMANFSRSSSFKSAFARSQSKLDLWIAEALHDHKMHIYFLVILCLRKSLKDYYYPEASIIDCWKVIYIVKALIKYQDQH